MMNSDQSHLATLATRITTSSAMNPALTMCLIAVPLCLSISGGLFFASQYIAASLFMLIGIVPAAIACWQLVYFTLRDPDRLQREQHVEKKMMIQQQIGVRTEDGMKEIPIQISPVMIANPEAKDATSE
ncbi:hypothetical protein BRX37_21335 [Sphingomonas sp. S-NIH.Pt3_0716]|nr:hypothetical protein BRX37_21335 [Sphingomonas sp. S-NIH.Pt3_0716]